MAAELGAAKPTLEAVARLLPKAAEAPPEDFTAVVMQVLDEALTACQTMRTEEGAAMQQVLQGHAARLRELHAGFQDAAAGRVDHHRELLIERLREAVAERSEISDEVLVRELAVYADRIDITEEVDRLAAHLDALDRLLASDGAVGKKIEFLLQECGREVNTTGSKANDAALQQLVVEAKSVLDQLKEQTANIL